MFPLLLWFLSLHNACNAFHTPFIPKRKTHLLESSSSSSNYFLSSSNFIRRRNVSLPLVDIAALEGDEDETKKFIVPLPSSHLPGEVATLNLYAYELTSPVYGRLLDKVEGKSRREFGFVIGKNPNPVDETGYVGSIGCAVEMLATAKPMYSAVTGLKSSDDTTTSQPIPSDEESSSSPGKSVLTRGTFRFVVRSIESTFPFLVAVVDELYDSDEDEEDTLQEGVADDTGTETKDGESEDDDGPIFYSDFEEDLDYGASTLKEKPKRPKEKDEDYSMYEGMTPNQLLSKCIENMKIYVKQKLDKQPLSPLEESILENAGMVGVSESTKATAEEMAAVLDVFLSTIFPEITSSYDRIYSVTMLAAEIAEIDNAVRKQILQTTDSIRRMHILLRIMEQQISLERAQNIAQDISIKTTSKEAGGDDPKELKVGKPSLPPWTNQIKIGMKVEYFWNEEWGWSPIKKKLWMRFLSRSSSIRMGRRIVCLLLPRKRCDGVLFRDCACVWGQVEIFVGCGLCYAFIEIWNSSVHKNNIFCTN